MTISVSFDPNHLVGAEKVRNLFGLSKACFYGPDGPYRQLPVIKISERRRAVRWRDVEAWLAKNTRMPIVGAVANG